MVANMHLRPRCFLDIEIANKPAGRVVIELFSDITPRTCENFRALCTGERGLSKMLGKALHYKAVPVHRVIKNFMIQAGDFTNGNGTGGESIYGGVFPDENFQVKHEKEFMLSMANRGKDTNGSQFFITTAPAAHLDGVHVVFGQLLSGKEVIREVENLRVDDHSRPIAKVIIANCGELVPQARGRATKRRGRAGSVSSDSTDSSSDSSSSDSSDSSSSDSESDSDDKHKRHKKKKRKVQKKKDRKKRKSEGSGDEKGKFFSSVRPDEIPDIPAHRFLYRGSPPKRDNDKGDGDRRDRRGPPPRQRASSYRSQVHYTRSGRKIKGRGTVRFRSRSRERERSATPPHWKREQERLRPYSKEASRRSMQEGESRWRKGDKLAYEDRWGRHRKDSSSEEDRFSRNKSNTKARVEERLRQEGTQGLNQRFQKKQASDHEDSSEERKKRSKKEKKQKKHKHKKRSRSSRAARPRSPPQSSISSPSTSGDEAPEPTDMFGRHDTRQITAQYRQRDVTLRSPQGSPGRPRMRHPASPPTSWREERAPPAPHNDRMVRDRTNGHQLQSPRGTARSVERVPTVQSIVHSAVHAPRQPMYPPPAARSPAHQELPVHWIKKERSPGEIRSSSSRSRSRSRSKERQQRSEYQYPEAPSALRLEDVPLPGLSPPTQADQRYGPAEDAPPSPSSSSSDGSPAPQLPASPGSPSDVYTQVKGNNLLMAKPGRILRRSISRSPSKSESGEEKGEDKAPKRTRSPTIPGLSPEARSRSRSRSRSPRSRSRSPRSRSRSRSRSARRSPWPPRRDSPSPRRGPPRRQSRSRSPITSRSGAQRARSPYRQRSSSGGSQSPRRHSRSPRRRPARNDSRERRRRSPSSSGSDSSFDNRRTFSRKRTPDYVPHRKVYGGRYQRDSRSRSRSRGSRSSSSDSRH